VIFEKGPPTIQAKHALNWFDCTRVVLLRFYRHYSFALRVFYPLRSMAWVFLWRSLGRFGDSLNSG